MSAFAANGTRLTASTISTTPVTDPDPVVTVNTDVYEGFYYQTGRHLGEIGKRLKWKSGTQVRTSEVTALFSPAVVNTVTPATGPAAGGTVITLTGTGLDGVSAVTVGGTAATALQVVSPTEVRVTTPAGTAGAKDIVLTDDSGTVTEVGAFTYTA